MVNLVRILLFGDLKRLVKQRCHNHTFCLVNAFLAYSVKSWLSMRVTLALVTLLFDYQLDRHCSKTCGEHVMWRLFQVVCIRPYHLVIRISIGKLNKVNRTCRSVVKLDNSANSIRGFN